MTDLLAAFQLSRGRYSAEVEGLSQEQLNWRPYPGALSIGEMSLHLAGVEIWFSSQLTGTALSEEDQKLAKSATEGVVNENPFPFSEAEITPDLVYGALARGRAAIEPLMADPDPVRSGTVQSALGPVIDGTGTLARMTFHPGYHHGQAYQMKMDPRFPK